MKLLITELTGHLGDESSVGLVHLEGPMDSTACGLAYEEFNSEDTSKPITCSTCLIYWAWAKKVSKLKQI